MKDQSHEEADALQEIYRKGGDTLAACVNCGLVYIADNVAVDALAVRRLRVKRTSPHIFEGRRCCCQYGTNAPVMQYRLIWLKGKK